MRNVELVVDGIGVWLVLPDGTQVAAEPGILLGGHVLWLWLPDAHFRTVVRTEEVLVVRHRQGGHLYAWDLLRMGVADLRVDGDRVTLDGPAFSLLARDPNGRR